MKIERQGRVEVEIDQYQFVFIVALTEKGIKTMCTREQCDGKQVIGEIPVRIKEKARKKAIAEFKKPIDDQPFFPFCNSTELPSINPEA